MKLNNPLYKDIVINNDWLSDAAEDDAELWEALSAEHCPPLPSSPTVTIAASSHGEHFVLMIVDNVSFGCVFTCRCSIIKVYIYWKSLMSVMVHISSNKDMCMIVRVYHVVQMKLL